MTPEELEVLDDAIKIFGGALAAVAGGFVVTLLQNKHDYKKLVAEQKHQETMERVSASRRLLEDAVEKFGKLSFAEADYRAALTEWVDPEIEQTNDEREIVQSKARSFREAFRHVHDIEGDLFLAIQGKGHGEVRSYVERIAKLYQDGELEKTTHTKESLYNERDVIHELRKKVLALLGTAYCDGGAAFTTSRVG